MLVARRSELRSRLDVATEEVNYAHELLPAYKSKINSEKRERDMLAQETAIQVKKIDAL